MFRLDYAFALVLCAASPCFAQEHENGDPALALLHERTTQFLDAVSLDRTETALKELVAGGPLEKQTDAVSSLTAKIRDLEKKYGTCRGVDRVDARRFGKDLVLARYLYKCEDFPVVWYFTYYRDFKRTDLAPESESWVLIAVRFNTDVELLGF